ncbi:hypothetical protein LTR53_018371, partial [Teratosphaeriaceae sp. CCFEE 6253]
PTNGSTYAYPGYARPSSVTPVDDAEDSGLRPFRKRDREDDEDFDDINMTKHPKAKKPRMSGAGFKSSDLADPTTAPNAKSEAQRQFEKAKERKALDKAKLEGRFIMLQAKLRGKKRIVSLPVPSARLHQLVAQQHAKAALTAGEEADAEHEVVEGAAQARQDEGTTDALLKSDIAPRKVVDEKAKYYKRVADGLILTSTTKKALIPVEKDDSYGYVPRERLPGGKRVVVSEGKRKGRPSRQSNVEYEEVDIGSEDER